MKRITIDEFINLPEGTYVAGVSKDRDVTLFNRVGKNTLYKKHKLLTKIILGLVEKKGGGYYTFDGVEPISPEDVDKYDSDNTRFAVALDTSNIFFLMVNRHKAKRETRPLFRVIENDLRIRTMSQHELYTTLDRVFGDDHVRAMEWIAEPNRQLNDQTPFRYIMRGLYADVVEAAEKDAK